MKLILPEHECLSRIAEGLSLAADGARQMMKHRPEQTIWSQMVVAYSAGRAQAAAMAEASVKQESMK